MIIVKETEKMYIIDEIWATRREIVFDYSVNACFEINRGVDQDISYALDIEPYGTTYYLPLAFQNASEGPTPYYFLNTGNYFGASPIKYEVATGDFAPLGLQYETQLDKIKTVTSKHASMDLNIVHYVDTFDVTYTVTVELDAPSGSNLVATTSEGDISGDGESVDIEVEYDGSTTISVVPGADWWSLSLDGVEVYASSNDTKSYTLSNVTAAHTITISYYTPPM